MIKQTRSLVIILILSLDFLLQCAISAKELPKLHLSHGRIIDKAFQPSRNLDEYFIDFSFINNTSIIQADFGTPYYQINNDTNQNNTLMTISISSNETVLFGNFSEGTETFNCDPSYCFEDSSSLIQYNSTWLVGNTTQVALGTTISLASGAWELTTSALYMTQSPELIVIIAGSVPYYGSIGLGTDSGAQLNFYAQNPVFSIFYNSSSDTGDLIFGYNSTYANTSKPSMTVTSDANWQMQLASISVGNQTVFTVNDTQPISMLFDLMITNIAFPSDIASNIVAGLNQSGLNCYETGCLAPNLAGLTSIIFTLSDNTQLTLEPEVYMVYNMDETDPFYTTQTFETLGSEDFGQNNIVFGTQILAYFYTVFQQTDQSHTITLYSVPANVTVEDQVSPPSLSDDDSSTPDPDPEDSSSLNGPTHIIYILVAAGVALIIVLILAIYLAYKRGWFKREKSAQDSMATVELNVSDTRVGLTL